MFKAYGTKATGITPSHDVPSDGVKLADKNGAAGYRPTAKSRPPPQDLGGAARFTARLVRRSHVILTLASPEPHARAGTSSA
ncbi:hypothetical protein GCM10009735_27910 [Actinomadura chokoriensis]